MEDHKLFPEGMVPIGDKSFCFACHPEVPCFTRCCRNVDLDLYPYDIIRLKQSLGIDSEAFMRRYTGLKAGGNPYFPTVTLRLETFDGEQACPFLDESGCRVYHDRPTACRTYPLERAVDRRFDGVRPDEFYFMTSHEYCQGHAEDIQVNVKQWIRSQRLDTFNLMNDLWAQVDTVFASNPWQGEGVGGSRQQRAFMACYNIDGFRAFMKEQRLLDQFRIDRDWKKRMIRDDGELLKFSFEWIKAVLGGPSSLVRR